MKNKRLASSIVALSFVAAMGFGYSWFVRKLPTATPIGATSASALALASAKAEAPAVALGKDVCEKASDRCACAAEHGAQLLAASFAERTLQLTSRTVALCTGSAFRAVRAEALAAVERAEEARKVATLVLQSDPQNRFARRALAIVAMQSKDFATSDATLAKLLEEDPKDVDSLFYEALSQRKRDHYNRAREGFLHALRLNAQHIDARYNLVTLTAAAGAAQEAEHDYQELLQIAPVGDVRLVAARAALNHSGSAAPAEVPIVHWSSPAASVVPSP
jgi:tetratricopeptide (TPR) repeat protein